MKINNKKIALIHVAKTKTGMTEMEYRAMLGGLGVESSKDLAPAGFEAVMNVFKKLGFTSSSKKRPRPASGKAPLMRKIYAILAELGLPKKYADGMAKKMFRIDKLRWCTPQQLHKIAAALVYHQRRRIKNK